MYEISLGQMRAHKPDSLWWSTLRRNMRLAGRKVTDDTVLTIHRVLEFSDLSVALWATRCLPQHNRVWRKLALEYAKTVQHFAAHVDVNMALSAVEAHLQGDANTKELKKYRERLGAITHYSAPELLQPVYCSAWAAHAACAVGEDEESMALDAFIACEFAYSGLPEQESLKPTRVELFNKIVQ